MFRRQFFIGTAAVALSATGLPLAGLGGIAHAAVAAPPIDVVGAMKALRIPSGPWAGGYLIAPAGRINWYFTSLGLLPIVQLLNAADRETYIRSYLDLYLRTVHSDATIEDVHFTAGQGTSGAYAMVPSDSDDSYAATLITLANRYLRASQNWSWWDANKAQLKLMAYRNLAVMAKPTGYTSVFQAPRNQTNNIGYLMDNCEAYRGLRDLASLLRDRGEPQEATYYGSFASGIAAGIGQFGFDAQRGGFALGDHTRQAEVSFYPGTTCQVFPQVFGVSELEPYFDRADNYLETYSPGWADGRYDAFPWAVLGFAAAQRGKMAQARTQMTMIEEKFIDNRGLVTINELGFYLRTQRVVNGLSDI
jgi:hypothetical protein